MATIQRRWIGPLFVAVLTLVSVINSFAMDERCGEVPLALSSDEKIEALLKLATKAQIEIDSLVERKRSVLEEEISLRESLREMQGQEGLGAKTIQAQLKFRLDQVPEGLDVINFRIRELNGLIRDYNKRISELRSTRGPLN